METKDLIITPIYLIVILIFAFIYQQKRIKEREIRKYFIPALLIKLIGAIFIGIIYQFYYGGGDTFIYFDGSRMIWEAFQESPLKALKLILESGGKEYNSDTYYYAVRIYYYQDEAAYFVVRACGLFGLFTFHTYSTTAMLFALFSFSGSWAMYRVFYRIYPHMHLKLALAIFFIPSVFFWGSGILKDSITLGALGWTMHGFYELFFVRKKIAKPLAILLINLFILITVKIYIALCFIPAAAIWLFLAFNTIIKSRKLRLFIQPFLVVGCVIMGGFATTSVSKENAQYDLENITETAKITAGWITTASMYYSSEATYDLGKIEYTPIGLLMKFPVATWLGLFRPYFWEVRNPLMLLSAIECFILLIITFYAMLRVRVWNIVSIFKQNHVVLPCLIFSISFAFAIGISSGNFGSLTRYKIPLIPLYISALLVMIDQSKAIAIQKRLKNRAARSFSERF